MKVNQPRRSPAIVGVGSTRFGKLPDHDATSLGLWAYREALEDAGVDPGEIDGVVLQRIPDYQKFIRVSGLKPRIIESIPAQGRMTGPAFQAAANAIVSGAAKVVLLAYGNDGGSGGARYGGAADRYGSNTEQMWFPYGMTSPGALNAMQFRRHMNLYGTTQDHLAEIAVSFRQNALKNPGAVMRKTITVEDHHNAKFICDPLRLLDYCMINDGGVAAIMTSADRAKDFRNPPVYLRGYASESRFAQGEFVDDFGRATMASVAARVYPMADVVQSDIDSLAIYDNFTPSVLFNLEGYGFCKPGESGPWIESDEFRLGGKLPINTSGGLLSESYMQGWNLQVEAVRQLRGHCGDRQVEGVRLIQYLSAGPISTSIIYGTEP